MSFRGAREKAGMSANKAAQAIGVSRAAISVWESGKGMPLSENLLKLAKLYDCSVDDLLRKEE